jgi:hypothetical protein
VSRKILAAVVFMPGQLRIDFVRRNDIHVAISIHIGRRDRANSIIGNGNLLLRKVLAAVVLVPGNTARKCSRCGEDVQVAIAIEVNGSH